MTHSRLVSSLLIMGLASGCLDDQLDTEGSFVLSEQVTARPDSSSSDAGVGKTGRAAFSKGESVELGELSAFIALQSNFLDFRSWPSASLGKGDHLHPESAGEKRIYINALPKPGQDTFPVGTIIVKTVAPNTNMTSWQVHAMAKRGAGFNASGAFEWQFFELALDKSGDVTLLWGGEHAPDGESYRTAIVAADGSEEILEQDCNDCHRSAANDAVLSKVLNLDSF